MFIEYNLKNLENLCADFFNATGINLSILDSSFNVLFINKSYSNKYCALIQSSDKGRKICVNSDKKLLLKCKETTSPQHHICRAGLMDIAVPIMQEKEIIGYIILQIVMLNWSSLCILCQILTQNNLKVFFQNLLDKRLVKLLYAV